MRKIAAIINSGAGSFPDETLLDRVRAAFGRRGVDARVLLARGNSLRSLARSLREEGFDVIAAGGGDGTVSSVASELVGSHASLGVLPLGTLNHFARDLGVPLDLESAVSLVCSGASKAVDVGWLNEHTFINNSSLGLYPDQVRMRLRWRKRIGKWLALVLASIAVLSRFRYLRVTAEFNGKRITRRCPMVLISNNEYKFEPGNLTGRERLDKGVMGIYLLRDEGRTGLLRIALHSLVFNLERAISFECDRAKEAVITTRRRRIRVALDGELYKLTTPLVYRSIPGGLRVIAPTEQAGVWRGMKRILHFSDIHFGGAHAPGRAEAILAEVDRSRPDVVAVSGDLTQRARTFQFRQAREFLDRISAPLVVVPGNHDVPLWHVVQQVLLAA